MTWDILWQHKFILVLVIIQLVNALYFSWKENWPRATFHLVLEGLLCISAQLLWGHRG